MSHRCKSIRPELPLYAEGEIASPRVLRRIERHLDECAACRFYLAEYDATTRRIYQSLARDTDGAPSWKTAPWGAETGSWGELGDAADAERRADRILDLILQEPTGSASATKVVDPRESRVVRRAWAPVLAAAAALLLGVGIAWGVWPDGGGDSVVRPATEPARTVVPIRRVSESPPSGSGEVSGEFLPVEFRWRTLGGEPRGREVVHFYGGRRGAPEFSLEVIRISKRRRGPRFFVFPDDAASGAVSSEDVLEVLPRHLKQLLPSRRPDPQRLDGRRRFRVVPVSSPQGAVPAQILSPPGAVGSADWARWLSSPGPRS
ncbi:MAG: zf-HC2 domain-containing protein [Planctomycetota bacterium]